MADDTLTILFAPGEAPRSVGSDENSPRVIGYIDADGNEVRYPGEEHAEVHCTTYLTYRHD